MGDGDRALGDIGGKKGCGLLREDMVTTQRGKEARTYGRSDLEQLRL
jgi:hypothetical protein